MCGLVLVGAYPVYSELLFAAPAANNNSSCCYPITQSRTCQEQRNASNWFRGAPLKTVLAGGHVPFPLGTPSFPWKCPIAFPRKKRYNVDKTTKKAGRKGVPSTRPALCRRMRLSHTADITAPVFHYTPFYAFSQGGECSCALVSGVGNRNPCAAFVVSHGKAHGGRERKYHPQRLNR